MNERILKLRLPAPPSVGTGAGWQGNSPILPVARIAETIFFTFSLYEGGKLFADCLLIKLEPDVAPYSMDALNILALEY
jgi:hypothetical protein